MQLVSLDIHPVKQGAIVGIGLTLAMLFGYQLRLWTDMPSINILIGMVVVLVGWLAVVTLKAFLLGSKNVMAISTLLEAIGIWLSLSGKLSVFTLGALGFLILFLIRAFTDGRKNLENSIKIKFFQTAQHVAPLAMTGVVFFVTVYLLGIFSSSEIGLHRETLDYIMKGSEPVIAKFVPGFSREKTVDEIMAALVKTQLGNKAGEPGAIEKGVHELEARLAALTGSDVKGYEKFKDFLYNALFVKILGLPEQYKVVLLAGLGIIIFGFIKTIGIILSWFVMEFAFLVYKILLSSKFMTIALENTSREVMVIT